MSDKGLERLMRAVLGHVPWIPMTSRHTDKFILDMMENYNDTDN